MTQYKLLLLLTLCLSTALVSCGKEDPDKKYAKLIEDAEAYIEQQKNEEARITLLSAAKLKPKIASTYFKLAEVSMSLKNLPKAVQYYRSTLDLDPTHRKARLHLATLMLLGKEIELAESDTRKLLEANPEDPEALVLSASIARIRKNFGEAKAILQKLIEKDPENAMAYANIAYTEMLEGNAKEAEESFLKALSLEPKNKTVRISLADLYIRQGRFDEGQELVETALEENPEDSRLRFFFAEFLLSRGLGQDALANFEKTVASNPLNHNARDRLFDMYLSRRKVEEAKKLATDLMESDAKNVGAIYFEGRVAEVNGDTTKALRLYIKAIQGLRNFAPVFRRAGIIELAKGDRNLALEHLNQAIAIDPVDVGARITLAKYLFVQRDFAGAKNHIEAVLAKFPKQIAANVLRADIEMLEGNSESARAIYEVLLQSFPNNPVGYLKLALLEEQNKNSDKAIELYRKGIAFDRNVFIPAKRLAALLLEKHGLEPTFAELAAFRDKSTKSKAELNTILGLLKLQKTSVGQKDFEEARKLLVQALEANPNFLPAYFSIARIDGYSGNLDSAIANYEKLLSFQPQHLPTKMLLALTLERSGETKKAATQYREILDISSRFAPAANNLAWIIAEKSEEDPERDLDEALRLAELAKEGLPRESSVADTLGWVYYQRGSARAALDLIEEAISLEKENNANGQVNPEMLYHLGAVKKSLGDKEGAQEALASALKIARPGSPLYEKIQTLKR